MLGTWSFTIFLCNFCMSLKVSTISHFVNFIKEDAILGFPGGSVVKICLKFRRCMFDPWVRKIPWRREWQPTPVFLPGESHRQRSLVGYSPWICIESDMTEQLTLSLQYTVWIYCSVKTSAVPMLVRALYRYKL